MNLINAYDGADSSLVCGLLLLNGECEERYVLLRVKLSSLLIRQRSSLLKLLLDGLHELVMRLQRSKILIILDVHDEVLIELLRAEDDWVVVADQVVNLHVANGQAHVRALLAQAIFVVAVGSITDAAELFSLQSDA